MAFHEYIPSGMETPARRSSTAITSAAELRSIRCRLASSDCLQASGYRVSERQVVGRAGRHWVLPRGKWLSKDEVGTYTEAFIANDYKKLMKEARKKVQKKLGED
jgi:hypothetical protein